MREKSFKSIATKLVALAMIVTTILSTGAGVTTAAEITSKQNYEPIIVEETSLPGKDDGTYITRATCAVIIGKMIAGNSNIKQIELPFTDIPENAYYRKYVCLLYQYKIVSGTSEHHFSPDRHITKEELLTMMGRTAELLMNLEVKQTDNSAGKFADAALIGRYAKPYVELMRRQGILRTTSQNRNLNPKAKITEYEGIILTAHLFILINSKPITDLFM